MLTMLNVLPYICLKILLSWLFEIMDLTILKYILIKLKRQTKNFIVLFSLHQNVNREYDFIW